ncbi:MAG: YicC/YloC family endoribonuclease [Burkholderiaceae bacterium]
MTGYASILRETPQATLQLELRSVNSRFLDIIFKIPDDLRAVEPALRERLAGTLKRGKVECRIAFHRQQQTDRRISVDRDLLAGLAQAAAGVRQAVPDAAPMTVADLLRWPGVLGEDRFDAGALLEPITKMAGDALAELVASRRREGGKLAQVVLGLIDQIEATVEQVAAFVPGLLRQYEERLTERLRTVLTDASAGTTVPTEETFARLRQEITLYGMRIDVAEELARLRAHAQEVRDVLAGGGAVGKRLDFLMQEMNREANTVGSKSATRELTNAAMTLKLLVEQIREQVQNIE